MNAATDGINVEREIEIAASPETIWELLTDERLATRWMGLTASFGLYPGGDYRVEILPGNVVRGEFVEIDPPHRLVYTWGWEPGSASSLPPGSTTVEFDLAPTVNGTRLRLRHSGLPNDATATSHTRGWEHYLQRLAISASGGDPQPDPWLEHPMT